MREDSLVAEVIEVATSTAPLMDRAQGLLDRLDRWLPVDATWMTLCDPQSTVYATVGSTGLDQPVLDYLARPSVAREMQLAEIDHNRPPISLAELPIAADDLPTWADCLMPAGFREGLGVPLCEPGGPFLGMLTLMFSSAEPPSAALRGRLTQLSPLIARGVSPMRSLLATTRIVRGATWGIVLLHDGSTCPLPGLADHTLLAASSPVIRIAREALLDGQVYRSFLWPEGDAGRPASHLRMTVLAATDVPGLVLGALVVTPDADCRGLTPRELQVLGLVVDGCSNQQIATKLAVATRTVAAHMEHLLHKLEVPTRTLAAVRAEREGCYVPPAPAGSLATTG